ncbi:sigma-70 family RNA polymerase sigma factor [Alicyclobacillus sendaiensis]|uniref:sigma-70 family RNA polymerase sigma factor n=1 Tax=Alicyclobacillus sendaiensis TaxID=192387 RepID=UPI0009F9AF99|nr:sigma-70 family RNA polymerase sigma factor [Alicyclobacillus sendaiensis]
MTRPVSVESICDEGLIVAAQAGNQTALETMFKRYRDLLVKWSKRYFLQGAEFEDLLQHAAIGWLEAVRSYRRGTCPFRVFARKCVTREVQSAVKQYQKNQHEPLNKALSLDAPCKWEQSKDAEKPQTLYEVTPCPNYDSPESIVAGESLPKNWSSTTEIRDWLEDVTGTQCTELERKVLDMFIAGYSYAEIAITLGRSKKSVDNALQRIKRRVAEALEL